MTSGQQELPGGLLAERSTASIVCEGGLQCCCVWPMCVSEDKTRGSAEKTAGHI